MFIVGIGWCADNRASSGIFAELISVGHSGGGGGNSGFFNHT